MPRPTSVRRTLLAGVLLASGVSLFLTAGASMYFGLRSYRSLVHHELVTQATLIGLDSAAALRARDPSAARSYLALLRVQPQVRAAAIYDARGALFASYVRGGGRFDFPPQPRAVGVAVTGTSATVFARVEPSGKPLGSVYLITDYGLERRLVHYAWIVVGVMASALSLSLLLSQWLHERVTRPIWRISQLAREIVEYRNYSARAEKLRDDEIGSLADAFNDMLAEIERRTTAMFESEARYRSLVEAIAQIIWVADAGGKVAAAVPSWQAYTGQSDVEVLGDGWVLALHPEDQAEALKAWRAAVAAKAVYTCEYRVRRRDGAYRWFAVRGVPVRGTDGAVREWVRVCMDIHDRRMAEGEARRLNDELEARVRERTARLEEANHDLEAFSYSVSHDLRAPLRAVDGFSQALLEDYGAQADAGMRRYLERIRSATLHMGRLIDDLLNLSRISRVGLEPVDVNLSALARQVLGALRQSEPERVIELNVWDDAIARGDPRLLQIALENLLGNAWKFTGRAPKPRIEFGALREPQRTMYFVRDNGVGFDMAYAERLFRAFHRLHSVSEFSGTGIGLATVQRVIQRHGGRIWAHAEPGKGATFYFTLGDDVPTEAPQEATA